MNELDRLYKEIVEKAERFLELTEEQHNMSLNRLTIFFKDSRTSIDVHRGTSIEEPL